MGPAYGRDPRDTWCRSRCGSPATLPRVAFRPPPLTPAPPAERLRSMASSSRHRSAVVAGRGLSRRVAERRRAKLPIDRVFLASAQPALTCLGSRCLANRLAPGGQPRRARGRSPSARSVPCGSCRARPIRAVDTRVTNFPVGGGSNPPGAPEICRARYRNGDKPCWFWKARRWRPSALPFSADSAMSALLARVRSVN